MQSAPTFGRRGLQTASANPRSYSPVPPAAGGASFQSAVSEPELSAAKPEGGLLGFGYFLDAVANNYFNFDSQTGRKSFWFFILYTYLLMILLVIVGGAVRSMWPIMLFSLGIVLPDLGIKVRRLHDVGKSGWWYLIALVPFGAFYLLYLWCQPSEQAKAADLAEVFA